MKLLIAFLASLAILAATPVFADDEHCVTWEKFVSQNEGTAKIEWVKTLKPNTIPPVLDVLSVPEDVQKEITEVRLFTAYTARAPQGEGGIAFGHDGLACVWMVVSPAGQQVVLHLLKAMEGEEL